MVYCYVRFSTTKQEDVQQMQAIQEYCEPRGINIDVIERDEGVSGGISYRDRKLNNLVKQMKAGDVLIVSEISRLGRSMSDLNILINEELKPRKVRLIVIKMGIDIDCSKLKAVDEMVFFALSFAAQVEKEMVVQRTQSALDARKRMLKEDGGFFSKSGRYCTRLGNKKGVDTSAASYASGVVANKAAAEWRASSPLFLLVENMHRAGKTRNEILAKADELYKKAPEVYCTRTGKPLSQPLLSIWISKYIDRYAI